MANELSTLGIKLYYAPESDAGTKPTTGFVNIPGIVSMPELGAEPELIDVTPLEETEYTRNVPGLKTAGNFPMTTNINDDFLTTWGTLMTAYQTAQTAGKSLWFVVVHPKLTKAFWFTGEPVSLPLAEMAVNSAFQTTANVTVNKTEGWADKPTIA
jgi:hypothetical protein